MTVKIQLLSFTFLLLHLSCANNQKNNSVNDTTHKYTNALIDESSPYLLQHAHNPVNWMPWGEESLQKARDEDKLVLVSIGYSSCHWCHVMEHESFEDEKVAALMNEHFVCIKVDREERPDVDQVYMNAVQLMTGSGGWPLNCFTLPDGRPVYGGTYFPKNKWVEVLQQLHKAYADNKPAMLEYAEKLTKGIHDTELIKVKSENKQFSSDRLEEMVLQWSQGFDNLRGGPNREPKFPLPNNYDFLMHYAHSYQDTAVMQHVDLTLEKMAMGGIYDQIGGGFARYSTDTQWKVPHFEKMLYDNAQLVSLYAHAYQRKKDPLYKQVVYQTLEWVSREMTTKEGSFYSALDADSEGEEGKFYVWNKNELKEVLGDDFELVKAYYNIQPSALWEGNYILHRKEKDAAIADDFEMDVSELRNKMKDLNKLLLLKRATRERPGLDDKSLTSWNCMMTTAYLDAYQVFGEKEFLEAALKNVKWFEKFAFNEDGKLYHTYKNGESKINGFLDDYAFAIEMYVTLYEVTFEEEFLQKAEFLTHYAIEHFQDEQSGMFYFTSDEGEQLVTRKMEISDNVIPSSNSVMARNLWKIGTYYDDQSLKDQAIQMLANVYPDIHTYGSAYSNWGMLVLNMVEPYYEIAITGPGWKEKVEKLNQHYIPNKLLMGGTKGNLPLLQGKFSKETTIYVCVNKTCKLPVDNVSDAVNQVK
ncbi:MAG: thioredoxin domain-containing protein [Crocinitomicaceae bacterium]|nr:thioredoxin domain-containing protein [Crocinitomicaceae bacterium]